MKTLIIREVKHTFVKTFMYTFWSLFMFSWYINYKEIIGVHGEYIIKLSQKILVEGTKNNNNNNNNLSVSFYLSFIVGFNVSI
jgi:hypothetical protein